MMNLFLIKTITILVATVSSPLKSDPAYLDPGSGSFILQLLIAALLGGLFIVKAYWRKIVNFFRGRSSEGEDDGEE